jgi:hypothetical protein
MIPRHLMTEINKGADNEAEGRQTCRTTIGSNDDVRVIVQPKTRHLGRKPAVRGTAASPDAAA